MFHQLLTPVGDNLALPFLVALLPIATVLLLLGVWKRPAWQAAAAGLIVGLGVAVTLWHMPLRLGLASALNGGIFALWPVMWMVINALLLYNVAVSSRRFDAFRIWVITHLPNDRRVVLIVVGFCFGSLLEGVAGFGPLGTGTAILLAALVTALFVRLRPTELLRCAVRTIRQIWQAVVTVMLIVGLAYVMNYSGLAYTLGLAVASTGQAFVLFSPFLGWIAVFLSGSDTSGNALFGNLQGVAARQLQLNPLLFAATNSSGGVLGKMISPQNIATGVSVTALKGKEGVVLARTFIHSVALTFILVLIVLTQQYLWPEIIPSAPIP